MQKLNVRFKGTTPIVFHNNQTVDSLNLYAKKMKKITSKRNKTDEDIIALARLEWEAGLYIEGGIIVVPVRIIMGALREAAKVYKKGKNIDRGVISESQDCPLMGYRRSILKDIPAIVSLDGITIKELDALYYLNGSIEWNPIYVDRRPVKVQASTIMRTRPKFPAGWNVECSLLIKEHIIDTEEVLQYLKEGSMGEMRYFGFGRYEVEVL